MLYVIANYLLCYIIREIMGIKGGIMNQEKFGKLIKDIRKKNKLTQKQLADKYNVTYQAVSKWENGLNMPDTALMLEISKDFGISLEGLLDCKNEKKINKKKIFIIGGVVLSILVLLGILIIIFKPFSKDNDFQFKTFSTECKNFTISGNISYNEKKAAIYVTNIKYCGADDPVEYKKIECSLYEKNGDLVRKISSYESQQENTKLQEFLENITLSVDNYDRTCKEYQSDSFYLLIKATNDNDKITTYEIPLKLDECN